MPTKPTLSACCRTWIQCSLIGLLALVGCADRGGTVAATQPAANPQDYQAAYDYLAHASKIDSERAQAEGDPDGLLKYRIARRDDAVRRLQQVIGGSARADEVLPCPVVAIAWRSAEHEMTISLLYLGASTEPAVKSVRLKRGDRVLGEAPGSILNLTGREAVADAAAATVVRTRGIVLSRPGRSADRGTAGPQALETAADPVPGDTLEFVLDGKPARAIPLFVQ